MNIKTAKQILLENVLDLNNTGMDNIPLKIVYISDIAIKTVRKSEEKGDYAHIFGVLDENNLPLEELHCDLACCSYLVRDGHMYYFREYFNETLEVIEALRTVNRYESTDNTDDFFTIEITR